jgi:hypothetical protein
VVSRASEALPLVHRILNRAAVSGLASRFILLHAGAVAWGNQAVLFPASSGSGKSTLVAGLVAAGCDYLSDEIVAMDPDSSRLLPFGNALSLKAGGRRALSEVFAEVACERRERIDAQALWRVRVAPGRQPAAPTRVGYIVLPRFVASAPPVLTPVERTRALEACLAQTYRLDLHGSAGFSVLVKTVEASRCFSLVGGGLAERVERVMQVLRGSESGGPVERPRTGAGASVAAG